MTETDRPSQSLRSVLAALGVLALTLGLLASYASDAQARYPGEADSDGSAETAQADSPIALDRHSGPTRYETSAEIATDAYSASTEVVIASGEDFADALSGAALEGMRDAPVLLVPTDLVNGAVPTATTDAIDALGASHATILGGTSAVSSDVADFIEANSTVDSTERLSGATRYETAEQIAEEVGTAGTIPDGVADEFGLTQGSQAAFVATGLDFPDALAAGPGSFAGQHPILLTGPSELHPAAEGGLEASGADVVFVLGGTGVVSSPVAAELESQGYEVERLSGADRWGTAKEVADTFADDFGYGVDNVGLATGFSFADALSSAPFLGNPAPLVLTPDNETVSATSDFFDERGCDIATVDIFGGQGAVQDSVAESYAETACPPDGEPDGEGTITGTVEDGDGDPIEGADVEATATGDGSGAQVAQADSDTTDSEGAFELTVTAPDTYDVTITADGFEDHTEEDVEVNDGETTDVGTIALMVPSNETFSLTPDDVATNPAGAGRDYEATGFDADTGDVVIQLAAAANVTVDNGTVTLTGDGSGNADFGTTAATITDVTVDGTTISGVGKGDSVEVDADSTVEITVVGGGEFESVVPVVYDGETGDPLPVDDDGAPTADFAIGGVKEFANIDVVAMTPPADLNPYGEQHTVTGTLVHNAVGDRFDAPDENWHDVTLEGETIEFTVYDLGSGALPDLAEQQQVAPGFEDDDQEAAETGGGDVPSVGCDFDDSGDIPSGAIETTGSATTDETGSASFSWTAEDPTEDDGDADEHCVLAEWEGDPDSSYDGEDAWGAAYKEWTDAESEIAGISLEPGEAVNEDVDGSHEVTATVVDTFGNPVEDVDVDFTLDRQTDAAFSDPALTSTQTTDANGEATWSYDESPGEAAEDHITAELADDEVGLAPDDATKYWIDAGVQNLDADEGDQAWFGFSDGDLATSNSLDDPAGIWTETPIDDADAAADAGDELRVFGELQEDADLGTGEITLQGDGAVLTNSTLALSADDVTIEGIDFVKDGDDSVAIDNSAGTDGLSILNNSIEYTAAQTERGGIRLTGGSGTVQGNELTAVERGQPDLLNIPSGDADYDITENPIVGAGMGFNLGGGSNVNVSQNTFTDAGVGVQGARIDLEDNTFEFTEDDDVGRIIDESADDYEDDAVYVNVFDTGTYSQSQLEEHLNDDGNSFTPNAVYTDGPPPAEVQEQALVPEGSQGNG